MAVYVAMEPPGRSTDAEATVFLRDGFAWLAFLFPPLWLLWHGLWIEAVLAFVAFGLLSALGEPFGFVAVAAALTLLLMLFIGLEGQALRIAALARRGWKQWGVVVADGVEDADARYAMAQDDVIEAPEPAHAAGPLPVRPTPPGPSIGLVPFSARPFSTRH